MIDDSASILVVLNQFSSHSPNPGGAALKNKPVQKYEILVQEDETGFVGIV